MKKYEYASVEYKVKDVVIAVISEYHELINQYAEKGYRYVGMMPTEMSVNGCIRKVELIFEKDE